MVVTLSSEEESSSQAIAVLGFLFVGGTRNDSQMGCRLPGFSTMAFPRSLAEPCVQQFLWVPLIPSQQSVETAHVLDQRFVRNSLKSTYEDNNVHPGVGEVSDRAQETLV